MSPQTEQQILNADPVELIRILFQHGITSIQTARQRGANDRLASIQRTRGVIAELDRALRPDAAPEIAGRLRALYGYMQRRLNDAAVSENNHALAEVLDLMTTLSEAWQANIAPPRSYISAAPWLNAFASEAPRGRIELHG